MAAARSLLQVFLIIIYTEVIDKASGNCLLSNGTSVEVSAQWINERGCKCKCVKVSDLSFEQCDNCKQKSAKLDFSTSFATVSTCKDNGFTYFLNETWMSSQKDCTQCKCRNGGNVSCVSDRHCSNTCQEGQTPNYGSCCEVQSCVGAAVTTQDNIKCWNDVTNENVTHGEKMIKPEACVDKFCICYNGQWVCHNYCQQPNQSTTFWNKLCCSRVIGSEPCSYENQTLAPGENVFDSDSSRSCTCLSGRAYCSQNSTFFVITSENSSTQSIVSHMLIILISLIVFVFCCLIIIVLFSNFKRKPNRRSTKKWKTNSILLDNLDQDSPTKEPIGNETV